MKLHNSKIIRHWRGSDVLKIFMNPYPKTSLQFYTLYINRLFDWASRSFVTENWVTHKHLVPHLENKGIHVDRVQHGTSQIFSDFKRIKHDNINILYYMPKTKNQRYANWVYCWDIVREIKEIFKDDADFIEVDGTQDMSKVYPIVDYYIRPSRWDGMTRMIQECQQLGIPYFWDETFTPTLDELIRWLDERL